MKLEHAKKLIYVVDVLVIAAAVVAAFLEGTVRTVGLVVLISLYILAAVLCSKFLRCPRCGKRAWTLGYPMGTTTGFVKF